MFYVIITFLLSIRLRILTINVNSYYRQRMLPFYCMLTYVWHLLAGRPSFVFPRAVRPRLPIVRVCPSSAFAHPSLALADRRRLPSSAFAHPWSAFAHRWRLPSSAFAHRRRLPIVGVCHRARLPIHRRRMSIDEYSVAAFEIVGVSPSIVGVCPSSAFGHRRRVPLSTFAHPSSAFVRPWLARVHSAAPPERIVRLCNQSEP